jgi:hypothetical protein
MLDQQRDNLTGLLRSFVHDQDPAADVVGPLGARQWAALADEAEAQGVAPVLFRLLEGPDISAPSPVLEHLRRCYEQSAMHVGAAWLQLEEFLHASADARLEPPMVLKGMALGSWLYPSLALRPVRDIDLLIRPDDRGAVRRLAEQLGYTRTPVFAPTSWHAEILAEEATEEGYVPRDPSARLKLDIHAEPVPPIETRSIPLWHSAVEQRYGSARALVPSREHLLLLLLLHIVKHRAGSGPPPCLLWWLDVALLLRECAAQLDWDEVMSAGSGLDEGIARLVAECLVAVEESFALGGVPGPVLGALARGSSPRAEHDLFGKVPGIDLREARVVMARSRRLSSPLSRIRWALGYAFPSPGYVRADYGITTRRGLVGWYALRPFTALRELMWGLRSG